MRNQLESPEFYVNDEYAEYVWHGPRFSVVRFGQVSLMVDGKLIDYTDGLIKKGITTDSRVKQLCEEQVTTRADFCRFEIEEMGVDSDEFCPDSYETLSDAIAAAKELEKA
jgi:hypothetical protein